MPAELPWFLRCMWRPADMLSRPVARIMPIAMRQRLQLALGGCDLDELLSPERWIVIRLLHCLIAGVVAALAAALMGLPAWMPGLAAGAVGYISGGQWLRQQRLRRANSILKDLPSYLDVLTLCVEAGATLTTGLRLAVEKSPPGPLRQVFERVLREIRSGRTRVDAFGRVARIYDLECLSALAAALIHSEGSGMSLGAVLRAQSLQRTAERFARAERIALQAPVKMLGPLILCIFPCTFIVIGIPIVVRILGVASE